MGKTRNGIGFGYRIGMASKGSLLNQDDNADAFIAAAGIIDTTQKRAITNLVKDLKAINKTQSGFIDFTTPSNGVIRAFYPLCGSSASQQKYNLIDPRDSDDAFRIVFANDSVGAHTNMGYKPNGTNQYGDTKLNPSSVLTAYNTHLSISVLDDSDSIKNDIGASDGPSSNISIISKYNGYLDLTQYTYANHVIIPIFTSKGIFISNRTSNVNFSGYVNGKKANAYFNTESGTLPNRNIYLGAMNYSSIYYGNKQYGCASIGSGLSDDAAELFDAAIYRYLYALGRIDERIKQIPVRAGVAISRDDWFPVLNDTNKLIILKNAFGFTATFYLFENINVSTITIGQLLLDNGFEFGTHADIETYRATHTPAETWTALISKPHNEIIAKFSVIPKTFANHFTCTHTDRDLLDYLIENHNYTNVRLGYIDYNNNLYDGTDQQVCGKSLDNLSTFNDYKLLIDDAYNNGKILVLVYHNWGETVSNTYITSALFDRIVAYVASKNMTFYNIGDLVPEIFE